MTSELHRPPGSLGEERTAVARVPESWQKGSTDRVQRPQKVPWKGEAQTDPYAKRRSGSPKVKGKGVWRASLATETETPPSRLRGCKGKSRMCRAVRGGDAAQAPFPPREAKGEGSHEALGRGTLSGRGSPWRGPARGPPPAREASGSRRGLPEYVRPCPPPGAGGPRGLSAAAAARPGPARAARPGPGARGG